MRAWKIAGSAIAAVIVLAVLLLIVGVPSGFLTSAIQSRVEAATGYRLSIAGSTRIGLWPSLNVTMHDVTLQDAKGRDDSHAKGRTERSLGVVRDTVDGGTAKQEGDKEKTDC